MYICYIFPCLCSSLLRRSLRVREMLGSIPGRGHSSKLSILDIFAVIISCRTKPAQLRLLLVHQWLTWQHQRPPFSMQHTIQQAPAAGTSSAPTSPSRQHQSLQHVLGSPHKVWVFTRHHGRVCCPNSSLRGGCQNKNWRKPQRLRST